MARTKNLEQNADIRRAILDAAGELMIRQGIKETSLKDIAKELGISKGTLYYHYSAKEDIIYDLAIRHMEKMTRELLALVAAPDAGSRPEAILYTVFEHVVSAETRGTLHLYLIGEAVVNNPVLKQKFTDKFAEWRGLLEQGIAALCDKAEADRKLLAYLLLAALDGFVIQKLLGTEPPLRELAGLVAGIMEPDKQHGA